MYRFKAVNRLIAGTLALSLCWAPLVAMGGEVREVPRVVVTGDPIFDGGGGGGGGTGGGGQGRLSDQLLPNDNPEVALVELTKAEDLQCAKSPVGRFSAADLNRLGRTTSRDSYESRHDAMAAIVAVARMNNALQGLIVARTGPGAALGLGPVVIQVTYADGGTELWKLELSTYTGNSVNGSPEKMGDGVAKTAECAKG